MQTKVGLQEVEWAAQAAYDATASFYGRDFGEEDLRIARFLENLPEAKSEEPRMILDLGCGTGRYASFLATGGRYVGIDISRRMLEVAREDHPELQFFQMSAAALGFRDRTFDGVVAMYSLQHVVKLNIGIVLREIRRVLKVDGIALIALPVGDGEGWVSNPYEEFEVNAHPAWVAYWTITELTPEFASAGLEMIAYIDRPHAEEPMLAVWLCPIKE